MSWRVGTKVLLNVYDDDGEPVCQCHTPTQARRIVEAINYCEAAKQTIRSLIDDKDMPLGELADLLGKLAYTNAQLLRAMRVSEQEPDTDTPEAKK